VATIFIIFLRITWPNWQIKCGLNMCFCLVLSTWCKNSYVAIGSIQSSISNSNSVYIQRTMYWTCCRSNETPGPCMEAHVSQHVNENLYIFHMHAGGTPLRLRNVDPNWNWLEAIGFFPHTMSRTDTSYQMAWSHLQWWSPPAHRALCGFIILSADED